MLQEHRLEGQEFLTSIFCTVLWFPLPLASWCLLFLLLFFLRFPFTLPLSFFLSFYFSLPFLFSFVSSLFSSSASASSPSSSPSPSPSSLLFSSLLFWSQFFDCNMLRCLDKTVGLCRCSDMGSGWVVCGTEAWWTRWTGIVAHDRRTKWTLNPKP